jgi:hypothetical protein
MIVKTRLDFVALGAKALWADNKGLADLSTSGRFSFDQAVKPSRSSGKVRPQNHALKETNIE